MAKLIGALVLGLGLLVVSEAQAVTLTWQDNSTNETNFVAEHATAADVAACQTATGWTVFGTVGANITTMQDTNPTPGVTHCYRVKATNASGSSGYSNIAGIFVAGPVPNAPTNLQVTSLRDTGDDPRGPGVTPTPVVLIVLRGHP
jgi:hypothetical protein